MVSEFTTRPRVTAPILPPIKRPFNANMDQVEKFNKALTSRNTFEKLTNRKTAGRKDLSPLALTLCELL